MSHHHIPPVVRRIILACAAVSLAFAAWVIVLAMSGLRDDLERTDVAVVLGSEVRADGRPSSRLAARLDKGGELYRRGLCSTIVVSGGVGASGHDEAAVMRDYLVRCGIPADQIVTDSAGINTSATARNVSELMRERGWTSVTVVTQYFHVPRTKWAFRRCGVARVCSAHAAYFELRDLYSTVREAVALPWYAMSK